MRKLQNTVTFLIAHTSEQGTGIAQAQIAAKTEGEALNIFERDYPERVVTVVGIQHRDEKKMAA